MKTYLLTLLFLFGGTLAYAQVESDYKDEDGDEEYGQCYDYLSQGQLSKNAVDLCYLAINKGNTKAMVYMGNMLYEVGESSYPDAFILFDKGAELGNTNAMVMAGLMHYLGQGTKEDRKKSKELLTKAAKLGNEQAANSLRQLKF